MINQLVNGDFMSLPSFVWQNKATVRLPGAWDLFAYDPAGHMPECYTMMMGPPQNLGPIWKVFTTYSPHEYALGQRVIVPVGADLFFRAGVWAWSSDKDDPLKSEGQRSGEPGSYHTRIGIDPLGGVYWRAPEIVWDYPKLGHKVMDCPDQHQVITKAQAGIVTVWLHGQHEWALKHGDAYWFAAELEVLGGDEPPSGDYAALEARVRRIEDFLASFRTG